MTLSQHYAQECVTVVVIGFRGYFKTMTCEQESFHPFFDLNFNKRIILVLGSMYLCLITLFLPLILLTVSLREKTCLKP
jgi:hypothetical protein